MTMQFGLVGTDGIALVSDTHMYDENGEIRTTSNASKFRLNQQGTIATAWAMKSTGQRVAKAILRQMVEDSKNPERSLEQIAEEEWHKVADKRLSQLLVALRTPRPRLFAISLSDTNVMAREIESKVTAGDEQNAAIYFVERYYKKCPVRQLALIAAHAVLLAAELSNGTIGGLDIRLCQPDGFYHLSTDSRGALEAQVQELDGHLGHLLIAHAQEFTYIPDVIG